MLSILCVRLTIKVKVGIPESFKVGWYPPKKLGRVTLRCSLLHARYLPTISAMINAENCHRQEDTTSYFRSK